MKNDVLKIKSSWFQAVITFGKDDCVDSCTPVLHYLQGWSRKDVEHYCAKKGWKIFVEKEGT